MTFKVEEAFQTAPTAPAPLSGATLRPKGGRLGLRLGLGFGTLLFLMLIGVAMSLVQIRTMNDLTQRFGTQELQRLTRVQALSLYTEGAGNALLRLMNAPRDQRVAEYTEVDERNRRIDTLVMSLQAHFDDSAQQETLKQLIAARARYAEAFIAMADEVEGDELKAARKVYTEQVRPALQSLLLHSNTLQERENANISKLLVQAQDQFNRIFVWLVVLGFIAMVFAAVLAWRTTRSVVVPLTALEAAAQRIALGDYSTPPRFSGSQEVVRVGLALSSMAAAIEAREREIERLAYRDTLTGLPNRTYLLQPPPGAPAMVPNTLILLDLARLKIINETLGHATGDTLIREVGRRAEAVMYEHASGAPPQQASAVLAHLSAGRFALALQAASRRTADELRRKLELAMREPVVLNSQSVDLSLVCGLADVSDPLAPGATLTLLRNAEIALQAAKRVAQPQAWYNEAQEAARLSYLGLLSDLREALASSQLQMWLQPKLALPGGAAVGVEALVRWQHPTRGFISPAEFIPFAEQTGAITLVTQWMVAQAVRTLAQWAGTHPGLSISVNISTRDLQDTQLLNTVQKLLASHHVAPQLLHLEIVESGLMQDPERSVAMLQSLRALGVQLSIDDFGTGYSSLAYLQRLPVTELKIDRSFVTGLDQLPLTQRLVKTMVELGHSMELMVTAEGVETEAERQTLIALGCDVMQGYLGSRPLFGEPLRKWLQGLTSA